VAGVDVAKFSGHMYGDNFSLRTSSILSEDYVIKPISREEMALRKYSKIKTTLVPNSIISTLSMCLEENEAIYSPVTTNLMLKVTLRELEIKMSSYRY
jgi:hypothetical protein